jgi:hypothetical protein
MQQVDTVYRAAEEQAKAVTDAARAEANQTLATAKRDGRNVVHCFGKSADRATRKDLSLSH